jgi:hypothetical protein
VKDGYYCRENLTMAEEEIIRSVERAFTALIS